MKRRVGYFLLLPCGLVALMFLWLSTPLRAQQDSADAARSKKDSNPVELPDIVITGQESLTVKGGRKAPPKPTDRLKQRELDQLNSLEKQAPHLLPTVGMPDLRSSQSPYTGFARASLGMFPSLGLQAGLSAHAGGYDLYAQGGVDLSGGHVDNAGFAEFGLDLNAEYLAPAKFWIFGGSKTSSHIGYHAKVYKLYAQPEAPERTAHDFALSVDSKGSFEGFFFDVGLGLEHLSLAQEGDLSNTAVLGDLTLQRDAGDLRLGASARLNLQSLRGQGLNYSHVAASVEKRSTSSVLSAEAGLQLTGDSRNMSRGGLLANARGEFRLNENFTARLRLRSGLEESSYRERWQQNPYIDSDADVAFAYTIIGAGGQILYHPLPHLSVGLGLNLRLVDDMPVWTISEASTFMLAFEDATAVDFRSELRWRVSDSDHLNAQVVLAATTLSEGSTDKTYLPPLEVALQHIHWWSEQFHSSINVQYVGQRNADIANTVKLDAYIDVGIDGTYQASDDIHIFVVLRNLFGSRIFVWEGYKERGIFASAGLSWLF